MDIQFFSRGLTISWGGLVFSPLGPGRSECLGGTRSLHIGRTGGVALVSIYLNLFRPAPRDVSADELDACVARRAEPKRFGPFGVFAYDEGTLTAPGWSLAEAA